MSCLYNAASKENLSVKVNCVLMKGVNDDELENFVNIVKDVNISMRFIEMMPFDGNKVKTTKFERHGLLFVLLLLLL